LAFLALDAHLRRCPGCADLVAQTICLKENALRPEICKVKNCREGEVPAEPKSRFEYGSAGASPPFFEFHNEFADLTWTRVPGLVFDICGLTIYNGIPTLNDEGCPC
jgi:hypothetical protein